MDNLTQSILHQAFTGKLTNEWREQNPKIITDDNGAEELNKTDSKHVISTGMNIAPISPLRPILFRLQTKIAEKKKNERKVNLDIPYFNELSKEEIKAIEKLAKQSEIKKLGFLSRLLKGEF